MENSKEKQIEEMAKVVNERIHEEVSMDKVYEALYDAGYRKQSEGEWETEDTILGRRIVCSVCGSCTTMKYKYCPNCKTKMKGEWHGKRSKYSNHTQRLIL